jgi:hypothetical protein
MIGSQWWCLRRRTIEAILELLKDRPDITRFFRTTWIPDETFFQTLVAHLVPETEIRKRTLTFLMFTDYGLPVTFYNDHYDLLLGQDYLFARKISPMAEDLKRQLSQLWASDTQSFNVSNEGRNLYRFLVGRGRVGRRFAPRFWETEGSMGRDRELMIVVCKKWHVAKRLVERARQIAGVKAIDYLFNEEATPIPDLGGIENSLGKRMRHRRALLRLLFAYYQTDQLVICLDSANLDLIQDFFADQTQVRLLEIECQFTDEYLVGHAMRVGLAGEQTTDATLNRLLPTIRYDISFESDQLRDAGFAHHYRLRQTAGIDKNAKALEGFFAIAADQAREIAATDYLFVD